MSAPDLIAATLGRMMEGVRQRTAEDVECERIEDARADIARDARTLKGALGPMLSREHYARLADKRLHAVVARYEPGRGSLLILGPAGTGKSITLRRLGRRLLGDAWRAGAHDAPIVTALWCSAVELAAAVRETRLGIVCEAMRAAQRTPLLFLDELGQEAHDPRWLLQLLDHRYAPPHKPTLTTSGLTRKQLIERYGTGTTRRLTDPVGTTIDLHPGGK